jgi:hypothetical protein
VSAGSELFVQARQASTEGRDLDARLLLAAGITALAGNAVRPVVVGGTAVDFYAAKTTPQSLQASKELRASQDVDIITLGEFGSDPQRLRRILADSKEFSSDQEAIPEASRRRWWLKGAPLLVEVLRGELYGDETRLVTLDLDGAGSKVYLWGPEDTAWQYMQSGLATRHRESWERAVVIAKAQADQSWDWDYLATRVEPGAPIQLVEALRVGDSFDAMLERVQRA